MRRVRYGGDGVVRAVKLSAAKAIVRNRTERPSKMLASRHISGEVSNSCILAVVLLVSWRAGESGSAKNVGRSDPASARMARSARVRACNGPTEK